MKPTTSRFGDVIASPSNVVFLMLAALLCVGFLLNKISQENVIYIIGQVFAFYFGKSQAKGQIEQALMTPPPATAPLTTADIPKEN
jgi:hypothetical protein